MSLAQGRHQSSKVLPICLALSAALVKDARTLKRARAQMLHEGLPQNPESLLWQQKVFPASVCSLRFWGLLHSSPCSCAARASKRRRTHGRSRTAPRARPQGR